jgi:hypothetical protein
MEKDRENAEWTAGRGSLSCVMKMKTFILVSLAAGISALTITSCAYDPYYAGGGYGSGYGYGGSGFSTSYFVSTGSSRWAYDPYAGAYYDHSRRCYYDQYLNGYYPVGYRPRYVYGSPHPRGWTRGSNYCPPPSSVRSYNLTNYRDRSERYRSLGRSWSSNVRVDTHGSNQRSSHGSGSQGGSSGSWFGSSGSRSQTPSSGNRSGSYGNRGSSGQGSSYFDRNRGGDNRSYTPQRSGSTQPSSRQREPDVRGTRRMEGSFTPSGSSRGFSPPTRSFTPPSRGSSNGDRSGGPSARPEPPRSAPQFDRGSDSNRGGSREDSDRSQGRGIRGLGQG